MKVIDLLNKISNGEAVPEKIKIETHIFTKYDYPKGNGTCVPSYKSDNDGEYHINDFLYPQYLNDEIEIIEYTSKENEKIDTSLDDEFNYQKDITGIENSSIRPEDIELKLVKQLGCMPYENEINYETGEIKIHQGYDLTDVGNKLNQLILRYNLLVTKYDATKEKEV